MKRLFDNSQVLKLFSGSSFIIPGTHNIRPAGQIWPTEAFYPARKVRKAHDFANLDCLFP
jgi:hypothetical protein